jgi:hypothetical protein
VQFAYCGCCGVPGSVGEGENADGPSVDGNQDSRMPRCGQFVSPSGQVAEVNAFNRHQAAVAHQDSSAVNLTMGSMTGNVAERRGHKFRDSLLVGAAHDSLRKRMLRFALHCGGERQKISLGEAVRDHIGDLWFPLVRLPVLSITTVSMWAEVSSAAAFLKLGGLSARSESQASSTA